MTRSRSAIAQVSEYHFDWPPLAELQARCRRLSAVLPSLALADHRIEILSLRPYWMPKGWSIRAHEHSFFEASVLLSGGALTANVPPAVLRPGHLFVHAPRTAHAWSAPAEDCLRLILWFRVIPSVQMPIGSTNPYWPDLLFDISRLLSIGPSTGPGWRNMAAAYLATVFGRVLTLADLEWPPDCGPECGEDLPTLVESFLADNIRYPIQVGDVARQLGVSQSALMHRYRALTGATVAARFSAIRMEHAAHILLTTELTLDAVSELVGLTDAAHLCRNFKRYFRQTPASYRNGA